MNKQEAIAEFERRIEISEKALSNHVSHDVIKFTKKIDAGIARQIELYKVAIEALRASEIIKAQAARIEELNELELLDLHQIGNSMDMGVAGLPAKTFMAALVKMFEDAKATNFLTITANYNENHYGITIQRVDGEQTPEEKIASLTARIEELERGKDNDRTED